MEETTYSDAKVIALLKSRYLPVRVDQDANPDLSARYGDWGWPATIIIAPDGTELIKRRGYIPPANMASLLQAVIDDPTPGPSIIAENIPTRSDTATISTHTRQLIEQRFRDAYDTKNGGWGDVHKFIDTDFMDWALRKSERGDVDASRMARTTLDRARALIDPVWGGLYQYSDSEDWRSPHYEKIMWYQANGLRQYALAYTKFKDPAYLHAAEAIYKFLTTKLQAPAGGFYVSQDADVDAALPGADFYRLTADERHALGREPKIDMNIYSRESGWAISGLVAFSDSTGMGEPVILAERAADWILANRRGPDGFLSHGANDRGGPFLGDTISMGNAALDLYTATGDRKWLRVAQKIETQLGSFRDPKGGYRASIAAEGLDGALAKPFKSLDDQVQIARLAIRLWRYLGDSAAKALADDAMKYLASPELADREGPGVLLADDEFTREPTHITIVGHKDDVAAMTLDRAARAYPATNKRLDWWDKREGPLANSDIAYPDMGQAAAFACGNRLCSLPVFSADGVAEAVTHMTSPPK